MPKVSNLKLASLLNLGHTKNMASILFLALLLFCVSLNATITIEDPSDVINPADWEADNARLANYHVKPVMYQFIPTVGKYSYKGTQGQTISHEILSVDRNDTSVVVVTDGADVNIEYTNIVKFGYASNLLQSSFFGKLPIKPQTNRGLSA